MIEAISAGLPDPRAYLLPEESIRLVIREKHPIVLSGAAAIVVVTFLIGVVALLAAGPTVPLVVAVLVAVLVASANFFIRWLRWSRTVLVITNRRLFSYRSLGVKRIVVMPVMRQSVVFRQSPLGRQFGFGTVEIQNANGATLYAFDWLGEAARFRDEVTNIAA